jgi:hypothetical protein
MDSAVLPSKAWNRSKHQHSQRASKKYNKRPNPKKTQQQLGVESKKNPQEDKEKDSDKIDEIDALLKEIFPMMKS